MIPEFIFSIISLELVLEAVCYSSRFTFGLIVQPILSMDGYFGDIARTLQPACNIPDGVTLIFFLDFFFEFRSSKVSNFVVDKIGQSIELNLVFSCFVLLPSLPHSALFCYNLA